MGTLLLTFILGLGAVQAQTAAPPAQTKEKTPEELAVERVQKLLVRTVDSSLPERTLQSWLREVFGPGARTTWELNDCGEQTGIGQVDKSRAIPTCVAASISLDSKRMLHLVFFVTVQAAGTRTVPPTFNYGVVMEGGSSTRWIKSLSEATRVK